MLLMPWRRKFRRKKVKVKKEVVLSNKEKWDSSQESLVGKILESMLLEILHDDYSSEEHED